MSELPELTEAGRVADADRTAVELADAGTRKDLLSTLGIPR